MYIKQKKMLLTNIIFIFSFHKFNVENNFFR